MVLDIIIFLVLLIIGAIVIYKILGVLFKVMFFIIAMLIAYILIRVFLLN